MALKQMRHMAMSAMALTIMACADGPAGPVVPSASTLQVTAGTGQSAPVGSGVATAPAVMVLDRAGRPLAGETVRFAVTAGGGSIAVEEARSGPDGIASAGGWTLGAVGLNEVEARLDGLTVRFSATGLTPEQPVTPAPPVTQPPVTQPPVAAGHYQIAVRYIGAAEPRHRAAVDAAVARWQAVIRSDESNVPMNSPAGTCFDRQPAINETVDDLLLFVELVPIDGRGQVLGSAGPCYIRTGDGLPIVGYLKLDADDLTLMETSGTIDDVVLHEIGHILGIGTLWPSRELLMGAAGADPWFTGSSALAAYRTLGGTLGGIPVENTGGTGTRDAHWRESVFGSELMTGYIGTSGNPLSAMTIASLQDLGYGATTAAAGTFSLSTARAGVVEQTVELHGREHLVRPKYRVDRNGRKERIEPAS